MKREGCYKRKLAGTTRKRLPVAERVAHKRIKGGTTIASRKIAEVQREFQQFTDKDVPA